MHKMDIITGTLGNIENLVLVRNYLVNLIGNLLVARSYCEGYDCLLLVIMRFSISNNNGYDGSKSKK